MTKTEEIRLLKEELYYLKSNIKILIGGSTVPTVELQNIAYQSDLIEYRKNQAVDACLNHLRNKVKLIETPTEEGLMLTTTLHIYVGDGSKLWL